MVYGEARLAALRRRHQSLQGLIDREQRRPTPSNPKLVELKHEKLRIIDEIGRLQTKKVQVR